MITDKDIKVNVGDVYLIKLIDSPIVHINYVLGVNYDIDLCNLLILDCIFNTSSLSHILSLGCTQKHRISDIIFNMKYKSERIIKI